MLQRCIKFWKQIDESQSKAQWNVLKQQQIEIKDQSTQKRKECYGGHIFQTEEIAWKQERKCWEDHQICRWGLLCQKQSLGWSKKSQIAVSGEKRSIQRAMREAKQWDTAWS